MTAVAGAPVIRRPGNPFPLGATADDEGTNFAVASGVADGMVLCLFDEAGMETQIQLRDYDAGVWHAFVPGIRPGQAYGYRATGPYDPARGVRCNPAKLLLDPYARAISGSVAFGPDVLDYAEGDPDAPSPADSAASVPRSLVVAGDAFHWRDGGHVHHRLLKRGLTNYWGYNTIGYFAPHQGYSAAVRAGKPGG
jgi:glycogen operon protein